MADGPRRQSRADYSHAGRVFKQFGGYGGRVPRPRRVGTGRGPGVDGSQSVPPLSSAMNENLSEGRPGPQTAQGDEGALFARLAQLGIRTATVEHPPVFTVEEAKRLRGALPGGHCKSLFLRNKKGGMWLVVALEDRPIDLKKLGERIGAGRVSFGSAERLMAHLAVVPGAVTPFAVFNDRERRVRVVLDAEMLRCSPLNYHPLRNDRTTAIQPEDLIRFLEAEGHPPQILDLG